jgi:hypothetical protein
MWCAATSSLFPTEWNTAPAWKSIVLPCIHPGLPEYTRERKKQGEVSYIIRKVSKSNGGSKGTTRPCAREMDEF